jgi:hypothetical protein
MATLVSLYRGNFGMNETRVFKNMSTMTTIVLAHIKMKLKLGHWRGQNIWVICYQEGRILV